jgi:hypothetical protein
MTPSEAKPRWQSNDFSAAAAMLFYFTALPPFFLIAQWRQDGSRTTL